MLFCALAAPSSSAAAAAPKPGELDFLADGMANPHQQQQQQQDGFGEPAAFGQDPAAMGQHNPYGMYPQGPYAGPTGAYPGKLAAVAEVTSRSRRQLDGLALWQQWQWQWQLPAQVLLVVVGIRGLPTVTQVFSDLAQTCVHSQAFLLCSVQAPMQVQQAAMAWTPMAIHLVAVCMVGRMQDQQAWDHRVWQLYQ